MATKGAMQKGASLPGVNDQNHNPLIELFYSLFIRMMQMNRLEVMKEKYNAQRDY